MQFLTTERNDLDSKPRSLGWRFIV